METRLASGELLAIASESLKDVPDTKIGQMLFDAEDDFGVSDLNISELRNRDNWLADCPLINVVARLNKRGNLVVEWGPVPNLANFSQRNPLHFDQRFLESCCYSSAGPGRKLDELMWFRGVDHANSYSSVNPVWHRGMVALFRSIVVRYQELVGELTSDFSVISNSRLEVREYGGSGSPLIGLVAS